MEYHALQSIYKTANASLSAKQADLSKPSITLGVKSKISQAPSAVCSKPVAERMVSLPAKEAMTQQAYKAFKKLQSAHTTPKGRPAPELLIDMDVHGALGLLLKEQKEAGLAIVTTRLAELWLDIDRWWGITSNKSEAKAALEEIEALLEKDGFETALNKLRTYEQAHNKHDFIQLINTQLTHYLDKENQVIRHHHLGAGAALHGKAHELQWEAHELQWEAAEEEAFDEMSHTLETPEGWKQAPDLDFLISKAPEALDVLIFNKCQRDRQQLNDLIVRGDHCEQSHIKRLSERLKKADGIRADANKLKQFINDPQNSDLKDHLDKAAQRLLFKLRVKQIEALKLAGMTTADLQQLETKIDGLLGMKETLNTAPDSVKDLFKTLQAMKRACSLARFMNAEQGIAATDRIYNLKTPTMAQMVASLEDKNDPLAQALYRNIESYSKTAETFEWIKNNEQKQVDAHQKVSSEHRLSLHEAMVHFQQARFHLRACQEQLLMAETKAIIAGRPEAAILSPGNYQSNRQLLATMDSLMQLETPVEPVWSRGDVAISTIGQLFKSRPSLNQRLAELQMHKDLIACQYNFRKELELFISETPSGSVIATTVWEKITNPSKTAKALISQAGTSLWQVMASTAGFNTELQQKACSILRPMLQVAERNPRLFRRMMGDFGQTFEQLKSLVGVEGLPLLNELQMRLSMESAASCFAGDEAIIDDFDPQKEPELASQLRRFQLLCDLASYSLHLSKGVNILKSVSIATALTTGTISGPVAVAVAIKTALSYGIREGVNTLSGENVRTLDKLVNFGPMYITGTSINDELAKIARGIAQNKSLESILANRLVQPFKFRLNKLTEAFRAAWHNPRQAWKPLAIEAIKCGAILGASAAALVTTYAACSSMMAFILVSIPVAVGAGLITCQWLTHVDRVQGIASDVQSAFGNYRKRVLAEGSEEAKSVELQCQLAAAKLAKARQDKTSFEQHVKELAARHLKDLHWSTYQAKSPEQARKTWFSAEAKLNKTEPARKSMTAELTIQSNVWQILKRYHSEEGLAARQIDQFKIEMAKAGMPVPHINQWGVDYYIAEKIHEIAMHFDRLGATKALGSTENVIYQALTEYERDLMLGEQLVVLKDLDKAKAIEEAKLALSIQKHEGDASYLLERAHTLLKNAVANGCTLAQEQKYLEDVQAAEKAAYEKKMQEQLAFQHMSKKQQKRLLSEAITELKETTNTVDKPKVNGTELSLLPLVLLESTSLHS